MSPDDAAPLNIYADLQQQPPALQALLAPLATAQEAELSDARAASFVIATYLRLWSATRLRIFRRRLSDGSLLKWILLRTKQLGLSPIATENIRNVFRHPPGQVVTDIYLNDPELQQTYRLALLPIGQANFLGWLTTHGREHRSLSDEQILWFLCQSAENVNRNLELTYLVRPDWQREFPLTLTNNVWKDFLAEWRRQYGHSLAITNGAAAGPLSFQFREAKKAPGTIGATATAISPKLEGVNMLGHFCNPSGLQQAALWAKAALERAGLRTSCRDVPVPRYLVPRDRDQWLGLEIFPVTILTQAGNPYFQSGYERSGLLPRENVYRIAYWNWELETVPDEWVKAAEQVDEIWSPTEFVARAMRARMPRPVYHLLPGVEIGSVETIPRALLNIPEDHFVFLFMFDFHSQVHRKNPVAVFRAFQEAFRESDAATLLIKTSGGDIRAADLAELRQTIRGPNVILLEQLMSRAQAYGLIAMCDCFVSLHRSEGFGLGLAEAMLLAKPVIATGYSGNMDFMNAQNSLLVDYEMVEITEDRPIYARGNSWAEPSINHAAALMRHVYENPANARERAERAQPNVQRLLSLEAAGGRMRSRLEQIAGH